jgi:hypothetical protein
MNTVISVKLLKPEAVVLPNGHIVAPVLVPFSKSVPGWSSPVPVHEQDMDFIYQIILKDEDADELPPHILADEDLRRQFSLANAQRQAQNHHENNLVRKCLEMEAAEGKIETVHDSFLDRDTSIPKQTSLAELPYDKKGMAVQNELRQQKRREDRIHGVETKSEPAPKPKPHVKGVNLDGSDMSKTDDVAQPEGKRGPGRPPKTITEE